MVRIGWFAMSEYIVLAKGSWGVKIITQTELRSEALNAIGRASSRPEIKSFVVRAGSREFEVDRSRSLGVVL